MSSAAWYQAVEPQLPVEWESEADTFHDLMSGAMGAVMFLRALRRVINQQGRNRD